MTPTVQRLNQLDAERVRTWFFFWTMIGLFVFAVTGWWFLLAVNVVVTWLEYRTNRAKRVFRLRLELGMRLHVMKTNYDEVRLSILEFEEEAETEANRYKRHKKIQFADVLRSIIKDIKQEIDGHEQPENA